MASNVDSEPGFGRLHVLTDYLFQQRFSHAQLAQMVIEGGADVVQFRQKHGLIRHRLLEAREAAAVCRHRGKILLVNDHVDIALAIEAPGVHLGQEDLPIKEARRLLGSDGIIGASVTNIRQAIRASEEGADYLGFGPVFQTGSKRNPDRPKGLEGLWEVATAVSIPVIAIAGITADRVADVLSAGAYGIAVMTAVTTAHDPRAATEQLRREIDEWVREYTPSHVISQNQDSA